MSQFLEFWKWIPTVMIMSAGWCVGTNDKGNYVCRFVRVSGGPSKGASHILISWTNDTQKTMLPPHLRPRPYYMVNSHVLDMMWAMGLKLNSTDLRTWYCILGRTKGWLFNDSCKNHKSFRKNNEIDWFSFLPARGWWKDLSTPVSRRRRLPSGWTARNFWVPLHAPSLVDSSAQL